MALRDSDRAALDAAIAANERPRVPTRGARGLLLGIPGGRARKLMTEKGTLTPAGEYYYATTAQQVPNKMFDYNQQPERKGNREFVRLLDGGRAVVRTYDAVKNSWRFTKTGQEFVRESVDRYVVTFPVKVMRVEDGVVVWEKESFLKSTATPLGEITVPATMPQEQQLAEVKRLAQEYVNSLPNEPGLDGKVFKLVDDVYDITMLDPSRPIEYNKEHIDVRPNGEAVVSAVLHRPLRGDFLDFGFAGVCPEAYQDSNGRCVQRQLEALTKEENLERDMDDIFQELYGEDHEENP
jgi:hypothetical protein